MPTTASDVLGPRTEKTIEVTPPGAKPVLLRLPSFREWYDITVAHRKLDGDPPAELIARTIAVILSRPDGSRLMTDAEAASLMDADPRVVMWLYAKGFETVLKNDDEKIKELEKN